MKRQRIYILAILLLSSVNLSAQTDTLFSEFLTLFPHKRLESKHLVKFLDKNNPYLEKQMQSQKWIAKQILRRTDNYIMVLIEIRCGAGGACESIGLYTFTLDGEKISEIDYSERFGDCGFMNTLDPVYFEDSILVTRTRKWEGDCDQELTESEMVTMNFYWIKSDGDINTNFQKTINLQPEYFRSSSELLDEDELNKLDKSELSIIRNELFASYGYKFKSEKWSAYFNQTKWHEPITDFVNENELSIIERTNLILIKKLEARK